MTRPHTVEVRVGVTVQGASAGATDLSVAREVDRTGGLRLLGSSRS